MELSFLWEYRLALQGNFSWWMQIFDNIMLFVPMGWLYGGMRNTAAWNMTEHSVIGLNADKQSGLTWIEVLAVGAAASFFIELCQLVFKLGLFEFDDILNNTIGMLAGYILSYNLNNRFSNNRARQYCRKTGGYDD